MHSPFHLVVLEKNCVPLGLLIQKIDGYFFRIEFAQTS